MTMCNAKNPGHRHVTRHKKAWQTCFLFEFSKKAKRKVIIKTFGGTTTALHQLFQYRIWRPATDPRMGDKNFNPG